MGVLWVQYESIPLSPFPIILFVSWFSEHFSLYLQPSHFVHLSFFLWVDNKSLPGELLVKSVVDKHGNIDVTPAERRHLFWFVHVFVLRVRQPIFFLYFLYFLPVYLSLSLSISIHCSFSLSPVAFTLHQGGDYHSKSIDLLSVCKTQSNDCVCWLLCKSQTNRQGQREWVLPGSEFSKGLLLVVVWCQNTVNGPLISFKRLKGLIERLTCCFIYGQLTWKPRGEKWVTSSNSGWGKWKKKTLLFPPYRELALTETVCAQ